MTLSKYYMINLFSIDELIGKIDNFLFGSADTLPSSALINISDATLSMLEISLITGMQLC